MKSDWFNKFEPQASLEQQSEELNADVGYQIPWRNWLATVMFWDGVLPISVLMVIQLCKPNQGGLGAVIVAFFSTITFFFRLIYGNYGIEQNRCSRRVKTVQGILLVFNTIFLAYVDIICINGIPKILFSWNAGLIVYVMVVVFITYPGMHPQDNAYHWQDGSDE